MFRMVEVEVNSNCNRKCSYCPNSIMERKEHGEMEPDVFQKLLFDLKKLNFDGRFSYHFFGEPMLCSRIEEYIIKTRVELPECKIYLYSNGDFINHEKLVYLKECGVERFIITNHEGIGHRFQKIYDQLDDEMKKIITYVTTADLNLVNRGGLMVGLGEEVNSYKPCIVPSNLLVITCKGNVVSCFNDYCQVHTMGNIMESSLLEIWNKEEYVSLRTNLTEGKRFKYDICRECNHYSSLTEDGLDFEL